MLHLLLDEHISPAVARVTAGKCPGLSIQAFQHWQAGRFLGSPDRVLLPEAIKAHLCLVTSMMPNSNFSANPRPQLPGRTGFPSQ